MLVVYYCTLNRWVTLLNVEDVSKASGWTWQPEMYAPLQYLVMLPFHWLSPAKIPVALNLFSAMCASLVLVLLARSVALLPQDRTEMQRERERSDFSFLTGWQAIFPPILAVLVAGLQLAFWERATNFTGDMFDLLLFAVIVWLLLEFRIDERSWRMSLAAVLFGAGIAQSWAFIGYLPVFLAAVIWLKKLDFFNLRFLVRMFLCGLAGMSLLLLLPIVAKCQHYKFGFWEILRPNLAMQWDVITLIGNSTMLHYLGEASLSTLLPILLIALRWSATFGDSSHTGSVLANNMMHFVYAVVFAVCLWAAFDPPFGARQLLGTPSLTLYFLAALSIGYFCGYFLLVFGRKPQPTRRNPRPAALLPAWLMWVCPLVVAGIFIATSLSLWALVYRNAPAIREVNNDIVRKFAVATTQNLPKEGAIVLSDSDRTGQDVPMRATVVQSMLAQEGRARKFPVIDTRLVNFGSYQQYLNKKFPAQWPVLPTDTNVDAVSYAEILGKLVSLSLSNAICYANPSYGYYFEYFYQEPHGLTYLMKRVPEDTLLPPRLDDRLITQNEEFWNRTTEILRPAILRALHGEKAAVPAPLESVATMLLARLHSTPVVNQNAIWVGELCSRSLDDWGVQLQRAGELDKAAIRFKAAKEFNPDNVVADINLAFNKTLREKAPIQVDILHATTDRFGKYRNWNDVVTADGPFDEISFSYVDGLNLIGQNGYTRQAVRQFNRVRQLAPNYLDARLELAEVYLANHLPDRAMEALQDPLDRPADFGLNKSNSTSLNVLAASIYFQKNQPDEGFRLLEREIAYHPENEMLLSVAMQSYFMRGLYPDALKLIDARLARSPKDVQWLFQKGYVSLMVSNYDDSISAMTQVLKTQTNNTGARFNRALAYFQSAQLDQARVDYKQLQTVYPNSFQIAYGLGEIANRENNTNEAIRNFQIFVANAPTNSLEYNSVRDRLQQLRRK